MFFEYPKLLFLLILPLLLLLHYLYLEFKGRNPHFRISSISQCRDTKSVMSYIRHLPFIFELLAIVFIIIAIARPRDLSKMQKVNSEGIDIVIALDVSTSMLARDFKPDRINAAKDIAIKFISQRPADRMGIVVFAGESYTQCPLTTDRASLINLMKDIQTGQIDDGTAIGNGLATAVARLKDSKAKSKVIILLTDGVNNSGEISPMMAAQIAKTYGIRVYTIGVGANGNAPMPVQTQWGIEYRSMPVEIDEALLQKIAETTGGRYFRATDNTKLAEIYSEINKLEKSKTTIENYPMYKELYMNFALVAFALLLMLLLSKFLIRRLP